MLSLGAADIKNAVEPDWLGVPMVFAGFLPETNERMLRQAGFHLEMSQVREEMEARDDLVRFHWLIARKPEG